MAHKPTILVIGAGAWGSALACVARRTGCTVYLWTRDQGLADAMNGTRENSRYLPSVPFPDGIIACSDTRQVATADMVLLAVPAQYVRAVLEQFRPHWPAHVPAVICAKGIETDTLALMPDVVRDVLADVPLVMLSGPSFAHEVAHGLPTAVTLAAANDALCTSIVDALSGDNVRLYKSTDITGVALGGAIKNVLAIACGIAQGRSLGNNARAALITRGIAEMRRLGEALGAQPETLLGLSGAGDLFLTCNTVDSRNFSFGVALGQGQAGTRILEERISVTEGVKTATAAVNLARKLKVEVPICVAVHAIIDGADMNDVIQGLLMRPDGSSE